MVYNDTVMDTIFQPNISRVKEATLVRCFNVIQAVTSI